MIHLLTIFLISPVFAIQGPPGENQIQDTLRFIRLAETRKNLNFSDEKLLNVNDILDVIESRQIELGRRERKLRRQVEKPGLSEKKAQSLLVEFRKIKQDQSQLELDLFDQVQAILTPLETIEFFTFYGEFRRRVAKRINMLRQNQRPPKRRR